MAVFVLLLVLLGLVAQTVDGEERIIPFREAAEFGILGIKYSLDAWCFDDNEDCPKWADLDGECTKNPGYMMAKCKKSCDNCAIPEPDQIKYIELFFYVIRNMRLSLPHKHAKHEVFKQFFRSANALLGPEPINIKSLYELWTDISIVMNEVKSDSLPITLDVPETPSQTLYPPFEARVLSDIKTARFKIDGHHISGMPIVGLGTRDLGVNEESVDVEEGENRPDSFKMACELGYKLGYRHFDIAESFEDAIEKVGLNTQEYPRRELFLSVKLQESSYGRTAMDLFVRKLANAFTSDHVDLVMLEKPIDDRELRKETWMIMEEYVNKGSIEHVGVSNHDAWWLQELLEYARHKPVVNQNKFSPYRPGDVVLTPNNPIHKVMNDNNIRMLGYSVGSAYPFIIHPAYDPHVIAIAKKHQKSPFQVLHRWAIQHGVLVTPKSGYAPHLEENTQIFDFVLSEGDMRLINGLQALVAGPTNQYIFDEDVYGVNKLDEPKGREDL